MASQKGQTVFRKYKDEKGNWKVVPVTPLKPSKVDDALLGQAEGYTIYFQN